MPDHRGSPVPADNTASSAPALGAGIASRSIGANRPGRSRLAAHSGSWPRPFAKKISLDCQLADLLIKLGNFRLIHRTCTGRPALAPGEQGRGSLEQCLLPRMDLAGMNTEAA